MLNIFSKLVESSEQNKFDEFELEHRFKEDPNESVELNSLNIGMRVEPPCTPSFTTQVRNVLQTAASSFACSASKTTCKNQPGRPKNTKKQTATSFRPAQPT